MRLVVLVSTLAVFLSIIALLGGVGKKIDRMDHRYAQLKETEGKDRFDYGREEFIERVWEWKREYGGKIGGQIAHRGFQRRLGDAHDVVMR